MIRLIFTNQLRTRLGVAFGDPYTTSGGKAIPFHASVRLRLKSVGQIKVKKDGVDQAIGIKTRCQVVKNRMGPPLKTIDYEVILINDFSGDDTFEKASKLFEGKQNFKIFNNKRKGLGGAINSYSYIKAIAEELRGLAVEFELPIFSATQTNRSGYSNSDVGLEDTSESFGLPATADLMFALITSEELDRMGQLMVKQLKNRYNDPTSYRRFVVGVDRSKMRLYDIEENQQTLTDDTPVFDKTPTGEKFKDFKL